MNRSLKNTFPAKFEEPAEEHRLDKKIYYSSGRAEIQESQACCGLKPPEVDEPFPTVCPWLPIMTIAPYSASGKYGRGSWLF